MQNTFLTLTIAYRFRFIVVVGVVCDIVIESG